MIDSHRYMLFIWFLTFLSTIIGTTLCFAERESSYLYVVPFATTLNENSDGSFLRPYSTLRQALDHIEHHHRQDVNKLQYTTVYLYPTYHFVNTLHFNELHSHIQLTAMSDDEAAFYEKIAVLKPIAHPRLQKPSISGGIPITNWALIGSNTYKATVASTVYVNQLFVDNRRIVRSRIPMNPSDYLQYEAPLKDPNQARLGFQYVQGQFDSIPINDAMVIVYHSWTTSHHYIDQIITTNRTVLFTNPSDRPIGTYVEQGKRRFHIENVCKALVPNSFCFVNDTKTVVLMTDGSYDPTKTQVITPVNEFVVLLAGSDAQHPVEDILIENVAIQHSAWNIGRTQQADYQAAAFLESAPLFIANATAIIVSSVEVSHTGSYGVWIKEGTNNINIINSLVTDTGAGGIRIGQMVYPVPLPTNSIKILSNEISYGGNVFPSGVAVISHRATDIVIADNSIHHHRYSGISIGWEWGYKPSGTSNVLIQNNYIYNTGQHILCDQGGIYTLGTQPGTVITGNVIKNVFSYAVYMWGIYLDEGTSDVVVSNNIVYNTGWASFFQHYGANNTIINNVFARASLDAPPQPDDDKPDGDVHVGLAENHTSIIFTNNIVYDTFKGANHSAYISDLMVDVLFNNNVYYNPYNTPLLFGPRQLSFTEWQKSGQDNSSMIADPLFLGNVDQCDFFTVDINSPAAKLGFSNITKLAKWTAGCDTNNKKEPAQFYYW